MPGQRQALLFQFIEHVVQGRDGSVPGHQTFGDLLADCFLLRLNRADLGSQPF
ncbi:hypothetical protein [Sinorhizobium fredii]|uniref:hypothetical protein n=1 Tax=Rhizobium fredii TaxID=380 RepID=UPI00131A3E56|nr:hypothetical protein [Sinorhizobium fredii]